MIFLFHLTLALISLIAIIYTCILFTNAIEHLGEKLNLNSNATGSILAVIGTGLPETIVPLVAIIGSVFLKNDTICAKNIAQGAIIGSPFMLLTFALFLLGFVYLILFLSKKRKETSLKINYKNILRNFKYFIFAYLFAIFASFLEYRFKLIAVVFLILLYIFYVYRTIKLSENNEEREKIESLIFSRFFRKKLNFTIIFFQISLSLALLIIFSHFFVQEITYFSNFFNISPLILSLIITPFATELPECTNSIIWLKNSKDDLAIANIIGGIVFQAMIPFSIGIVLTQWKMDSLLFANCILTVLCALFLYLQLKFVKKLNLFVLLSCGIFYLLFLLQIFLQHI